MSNRKWNILIVCEGYEEKPYMDKILNFPCIKNNEKYCFSECVNAKGNGSIFARYQDKLQSGRYDLVLVFCDTDKGSQQFLEIKKKFADELFGGDKKLTDGLFIFCNPVTLQIVLSHFGKVELKNVSKKKNGKIVEKLTGIKNYDAKDEQINEIIGLVTYKTYDRMKENLKNISEDLNQLPSTNLLKFLRYFESDDDSWISNLLKKINKAN
ncbi:MAG: hypothetical protein PHS54_07650 [Clostridia bacterium]|jgi:hypothetical protein|nr:hypothetical protein [Clostridia bacterium]